MKKTLNFDRFINERDAEPLEITVLGKKYQVKPKIPAIVPVMMARAEENMDSADSTRMVLLAADAMYGRENVDKMCADGLSTDELGLLVQKTFGLINGTENADDEDEEQELTDEGSKRPARTGKAKK